MASYVKVNVPDYVVLLNTATEATRLKALTDIEAIAKQTAPVDTGYYRDNIQVNIANSTVVANADYSAPIEYGVGGTARQPNPNMRLAAKTVQNNINSIFRRLFNV